jgi:spore coat protein U-like protein
MNRLSSLIKFCIAILMPCAVQAEPSGNVQCSLATTPLQFGFYAPHQKAPADSTGTITITCTTSGVETERWSGAITLTVSEPSSGRHMKQGDLPVAYQIYLDPARTLKWGDAAGNGNALPVGGTVGPTTAYRETITIYGRIPALQRAARVGHYADAVTAVLNY